MSMKVFSKGQVVIPVEIRRALGIVKGDRLEVEINREKGCIELHKPEERASEALAGALSAYADRKPFPTREKMQEALREGLGNG